MCKMKGYDGIALNEVWNTQVAFLLNHLTKH